MTVFFHDVVCDDIEEQARSLLGQDFRRINVVPIQQQLNGSDCGVFAIAFATSLVFMQDPLLGMGYLLATHCCPDKLALNGPKSLTHDVRF